MRFAKYEGLGNDFVLLDGVADLRPEQAVALCDRHFGIGADGVLLVDEGARSMRIFNADGTVPQMCGNGLRCVVWHLARKGSLSIGDQIEIRTDAGMHMCSLHGDSDVEVAMRPPTLEPAEVPLQSASAWIDEPVHVGDHALQVTAVGMGNPHAVVFTELSDEARLQTGPLLQQDERFPQGVNVGFGRFEGTTLVLHVLERGAGWTQACGTGACAAAVAAVETRRAVRHEPITVRLPGGDLRIVVGEPGNPVQMRGPARHVFDGSIEG